MLGRIRTRFSAAGREIARTARQADAEKKRLLVESSCGINIFASGILPGEHNWVLRAARRYNQWIEAFAATVPANKQSPLFITLSDSGIFVNRVRDPGTGYLYIPSRKLLAKFLKETVRNHRRSHSERALMKSAVVLEETPHA